MTIVSLGNVSGFGHRRLISAASCCPLIILTRAASECAGAIFTRTVTVERVIDRDTFVLCPASLRPWPFAPRCERIRLRGIDAPESHEPRGPAATASLAALIARKRIRRVPVGSGSICDGRSKPQSHERIVAQCFLGTLDIAGELVRSGHACDWRMFSGGHYSHLGRTCRK